MLHSRALSVLDPLILKRIGGSEKRLDYDSEHHSQGRNDNRVLRRHSCGESRTHEIDESLNVIPWITGIVRDCNDLKDKLEIRNTEIK